jgi:hypothetical protein
MSAAELKKKCIFPSMKLEPIQLLVFVERSELMTVIRSLMKAKIWGIVDKYPFTGPCYSSDESRFVKN